MPPLGRILTLLLILPIVAACSSVSPTPAGELAGGSSPSAGPCPPWGCEQQARFDAAAAFITRQPGRMAIVVKDRRTGAAWRGGDLALRTWAGSTPKLALIVYLEQEARAGRLSLSAADKAAIDAMLHESDNEAADQLWNKYANSATIMKRWQTEYGMTNASYVDTFEKRWGFVKLAPFDLVNLMTYVLDKADPADRSYIVDRMRAVGGLQQWGVWGAGPALRPGVKNGWDYCAEFDGDEFRWVTSTVGFVGPGERYVVAAMFDGHVDDPLDVGVHSLTDLVATVFGAPVPAAATVPDDY